MLSAALSESSFRYFAVRNTAVGSLWQEAIDMLEGISRLALLAVHLLDFSLREP